MGNLMSYSGIVTKIRAMQAKLLTEEDFQHIANLQTVNEVIEYLKEQPGYAEYMNQLDESLYHRRHVEKVLTQSLYNDYAKIFKFAGVKQKKFLKLYKKRYEVELINYCLRIVFNHYDVPFDLEYKKTFFDKYSQLSIEQLITSKNIDELVENLSGTEYYAPLRQLKESGAATLFDYDLALDLYYFSTFWKKEKKLLQGRELEIFVKDYGTKVDLLNLQWIYRAKKYYNMLAPDIYALTIPIHYKIHVEEFKKLVEAPNLEELEKLVGKTYYAKRHQLGEGESIEKTYKQILEHLYLLDRRKNPYSVAAINTYLFLKEEEINRLTTAMECIRYGLTSAETLAYIGGKAK